MTKEKFKVKSSKENLIVITAVYMEDCGFIISKNPLPIKEVTLTSIFIEPAMAGSIFSDFVDKKDINIARDISNVDTSISLMLYAYKLSDFGIRQELRRVFLQVMDKKNIALMQLINNFEENFKNTEI